MGLAYALVIALSYDNSVWSFVFRRLTDWIHRRRTELEQLLKINPGTIHPSKHWKHHTAAGTILPYSYKGSGHIN